MKWTKRFLADASRYPRSETLPVSGDAIMSCRSRIMASLIGKTYHENKDNEYVLMPGDPKLEELVNKAMEQIGLVDKMTAKFSTPKKVFRARVLIRVSSVHRYTIKICVPGWNHRSIFRVPKALFPKHFKFERGYRFFGHANLAARTIFELDLGGPFEEGSTHVPTLAELTA